MMTFKNEIAEKISNTQRAKEMVPVSTGSWGGGETLRVAQII